MKTPTHALVGYLSARFLGFDRVKTTACILGACLADLPLVLAYVNFLVSCYWQVGHYDAVLIQAGMDAIYFENSWLLIAHNLFHSPCTSPCLTVLFGVGVGVGLPPPVATNVAAAAPTTNTFCRLALLALFLSALNGVNC